MRKAVIVALSGLVGVVVLAGCEADLEMEDPAPEDLPAAAAAQLPAEGVAPLAPGLVPTEGEVRSAVIAPDGERIYLAKAAGEDGMTRLWEAVWDDAASAYTDPVPLHFSDATHRDRAPALAPGGEYLVFTSMRPIAEGDRVLEDFNIWLSEWSVPEVGEAGAWSEPWSVRTLHSDAWDGAPSVAGSGNLYFASDRDAPTPGMNLWVSELQDGDWMAPEPLDPPLSSSADDTDPWVAPDESFLLFASDRGGGFDLYVAFRTELGGWLEPVPLGGAVNTEANETAPSLSAGGEYLVFHRDGEGVLILPTEEAEIQRPDDG